MKQGGLWPILLVRLMWMPAAIKNYGLAVLNVPVSHILFCAFITSIPFAILWNYLGHTCKNLLEIFDGRKSTNITSLIPTGFRIPVFVLTLVTAGYVIYHGRRAWNAAVVEVEAREKNKEK